MVTPRVKVKVAMSLALMNGHHDSFSLLALCSLVLLNRIVSTVVVLQMDGKVKVVEPGVYVDGWL
jgi:hypothetical protein